MLFGEIIKEKLLDCVIKTTRKGKNMFETET